MISSEQKTALANSIRVLALIFNHDVTKEVIQAYVRILGKHDYEAAQSAILWATENCKFFPKPAELLERINPKPDAQDAMDLAGKIITAIGRFGYMQWPEAKRHLGETAWRAVNMAGGWQILCDTPQTQLGQLRAQLRDLCLTSMNAPEIANRRQRIEMAAGSGDWFRPIENAPAKPGLKLLFGSDAQRDQE